MDSIENARRILATGLETAFPNIRFVKYGEQGQAGTGEIAWVRPEVAIAFEPRPNQPLLDCDATFTVEIRHANGVNYAGSEAIATWLHRQRFTDAVAAIEGADRDFVRPNFLRWAVVGMLSKETDDRYRSILTAITVRCFALELGTVNNRSHPEGVVFPTQTDARLNNERLRLYP